MSEHVIRKDNSPNPTSEKTVEEGLLLYTSNGRQEFKDGQGNFRINGSSYDEASKNPYVHAINNHGKYFIKIGENGRIFNPYGLYSEGLEAKQRVGRPTWKFRSTGKTNFNHYVKFLSTKNEVFLKNVEREMI